MLKLDRRLVVNAEVAKAPNLCDRFSADDLGKIGTLCYEGFQRDKLSRAKWERRTDAAMDLAMQVQKDKNFPWPGCANVVFPLLTIAALQFSSRSYSNIIQGLDVVKYRVTGVDSDMKLKERADRIAKHMSWQVLEEDSSWEEQHDRLLINLAIVGTSFVKTYYSTSLNHNVSELVMARDLVLDYFAKSVEECARKTQIVPLYRNDVYERAVSRVFCNILDEAWFNEAPQPPDDVVSPGTDNRQGKTPPQTDGDSPFRFYEQHRLLDLDGDGYAEPYIVTFEERSQSVVRITARWEREEDVDRTDFPGTKPKIRRIKASEYFTKYGFIPAPDGGIYDLGYGTLLGPLNESVDAGINQLLDAGTMANSNGGFLGRGVKIRGGVYTMAPWEWKRVDSTGDDLRKSMVPLPVREPSDVMFKLLGLLIEYTDRIAGTTDTMVGVSPGQNTPAETSRNTLEQGMKVYSGIFKRIWRSMKEEFKKLHSLNAQFLEQRKRFGNSGSYINQEDYRSDPDLVCPSADPNLTSDSMRIGQAAAMREGAHVVPGYDIPEVEKNWLKALRVDAVEKFYPGPDKVPPLPNPKMQQEQMKLESVKMKLEYEQQRFVAQLHADRNKNQAEITKIYAEVGKLLAETQTEQVKAKVEAFTAIVNALETHNNMMTQQIEAASGGKENGGNEGSVGGMASNAGNPGAQAVSSTVQNQPNAAMGGGEVSG